MEKFDLIVIGAGAAGCFGAIQAKHHFSDKKILILERGSKPLQKVKISGGGRCNVTNVISEPSELSKSYPRGERFLKKAFYQFSSKDMKNWLEKRGIPLKLYPDGCYFPEANDSQVIIDCFLHEIKRNQIQMNLDERVDSLSKKEAVWEIQTSKRKYEAKAVLVTIGGQPKQSGFKFMETLDLKMIEPLPSLFTFNMPKEKDLVSLMGIVTENASVKIAGEKWSSDGPLLITHWGMSGPAVLKCSAFGARILASKGYNAQILVNWATDWSREEVLSALESNRSSSKFVVNTPLFKLKSRLWEYLVQKVGIKAEQRWTEVQGKLFNKLFEVIIADSYQMEGKTTFKEEFVTAGGVDLSEIDVQTMEAKRFSNLFFAGETVDIDGITGGFNFQAAWTTAYIAGKSSFLK